jgi:hypothetical protein
VLIEAFDALWHEARPAFAQERTWLRARTLALSSLVGLGRRTVTGMLTASAQQGLDWSAAYRLFEQERFEGEALFAPALRAVVAGLGEQEPLVALMDDTLIRKRGRKVHGAGWKRDPLGPAFCNNFIWGQRFVQLSAALPESPGPSRARGIPIDWTHSPLPPKPRRRAPAEQWAQYRELQKTMKVSGVGLERIRALRAALDAQGQPARKLLVALDGTFTNQSVFRALPERTAAIGRLRKDARLYAVPQESDTSRRGRKRFYGAALPSPEKLRQDPSIPWIEIQAWAAGQIQSFQIKTMAPVRWRGSGKHDVRIVVIRPLAYRPRKGARLLYRNPVYLVCSDPALALPRLLQAFVWRWEVEVNFRDEKTVLGVGEAQVRTPAAVQAVTAFVVAAYAFLLLAAAQTGCIALPTPKWRQAQPPQRDSTPRLLGVLRHQLWGKALGVNLTHVAYNTKGKTTDVEIASALPSAVLYAFR